ncbi:MAG: hypothetical protein AAFQ68_25985, partial [Bacteroidota bacterium]
NVEAVLEEIDREKYALKPLYQYWNTKDKANTKEDEDFIYHHFFQSEEQALFVKVVLEHGEIEVQFFYRIGDKEIEAWALETHHHLRQKFGEKRVQAFNVL